MFVVNIQANCCNEVFFFQAEDGIRDIGVTGVQTCALPIWISTSTPLQAFVTMNDPVYVECSQALGRRLMKEGGGAVADRVRFGLRLVLQRADRKSVASGKGVDLGGRRIIIKKTII